MPELTCIDAIINPLGALPNPAPENPKTNQPKKYQEIDEMFDRLRQQIEEDDIRNQIRRESEFEQLPTMPRMDDNDPLLLTPPLKPMGITKHQRRMELARQEEAQAREMKMLEEVVTLFDPDVPGPSNAFAAIPVIDNQGPSTSATSSSNIEAPVIKKTNARPKNAPPCRLQLLQEIQQRQNLISAAIFEQELALNRLLIMNNDNRNDDEFLDKIKSFRNQIEKQSDESLKIAGELRKIMDKMIQQQPALGDDPEEPEMIAFYSK